MKSQEQKLKATRKRRGHSLESVAHKIGVSWTTVQRWEAGKCKPHALQLKAIEEYLL